MPLVPSRPIHPSSLKLPPPAPAPSPEPPCFGLICAWDDQARSETDESLRSGSSANTPVFQTTPLPHTSPESNDDQSATVLTGHAPEPPPMHPDLDPGLSTQGARQLDHPSSQMPETDPNLAVNGHTLNDIMAAGTEVNSIEAVHRYSQPWLIVVRSATFLDGAPSSQHRTNQSCNRRFYVISQSWRGRPSS